MQELQEEGTEMFHIGRAIDEDDIDALHFASWLCSKLPAILSALDGNESFGRLRFLFWYP
jgi:hypothetical protein